MIVAISYGNRPYRRALKLNIRTAMKVAGVDRAIGFCENDIDEVFKTQNENILQQAKGNGYWLWKPYFCKKVLTSLKDGDFLVYGDAGNIYYSKDISKFIAFMKKESVNMLLREQSFVEKVYTKRDTFIYMKCDTPQYAESHQIWAGAFIIRKSEQTMQFVNEWLNYATDARILTDIPNTCGKDNYDGFLTHRHDQSIFSLLCKKYGCYATVEEMGIMGLNSQNDFVKYHHTKLGSERAIRIVSTLGKNPYFTKLFYLLNWI